MGSAAVPRAVLLAGLFVVSVVGAPLVMASSHAPDPFLWPVDFPDYSSKPITVELGEWVRIKLQADNDGTEADTHYLQISFPDLASASNVKYIAASSSADDGRVWAPGESVYYSYGECCEPLDHPMVENYRAPMPQYGELTLVAEVKPETTGPFTILYKTVAENDGNFYYEPSSGATDQQDEYVESATLEVVSSTPHLEGVGAAPDGYSAPVSETISIEPGERIRGFYKVTNPGSSDTTVTLGMTVWDSAGTPHHDDTYDDSCDIAAESTNWCNRYFELPFSTADGKADIEMAIWDDPTDFNGEPYGEESLYDKLDVKGSNNDDSDGEESAPLCGRWDPDSYDNAAEPGQGFTVTAWCADSDGDLDYGDWNTGDAWQETASLLGYNDSASRTFQFETEGTYVIHFIPRDQAGTYGQAASWKYIISNPDTGPPPCEPEYDWPQVNLEASPSSGPAPFSPTFSYSVTYNCPLESWVMDYGDDSMDSGDWPAPSSFAHTYGEQGTYKVRLEVTAPDGSYGWSERSVQAFGPTAVDSDGDGIEDGHDNCPYDSNPSQEDDNANGIGDACEVPPAIDWPGLPDGWEYASERTRELTHDGERYEYREVWPPSGGGRGWVFVGSEGEVIDEPGRVLPLARTAFVAEKYWGNSIGFTDQLEELKDTLSKVHTQRTAGEFALKIRDAAAGSAASCIVGAAISGGLICVVMVGKSVACDVLLDEASYLNGILIPESRGKEFWKEHVQRRSDHLLREAGQHAQTAANLLKTEAKPIDSSVASAYWESFVTAYADGYTGLQFMHANVPPVEFRDQMLSMLESGSIGAIGEIAEETGVPCAGEIISTTVKLYADWQTAVQTWPEYEEMMGIESAIRTYLESAWLDTYYVALGALDIPIRDSRNRVLDLDTYLENVQRTSDPASTSSLGAAVKLSETSDPNGIIVSTYDEMELRVEPIEGGYLVAINREEHDGRFIVIDIPDSLWRDHYGTGESLRVLMDDAILAQAEGLADVMNVQDDDGRAEFLYVVGEQGAELLVSIPSFSTRVIQIVNAAGTYQGEDTPTWRTPGIGFWGTLVALVVTLVAIIHRVKNRRKHL